MRTLYYDLESNSEHPQYAEMSLFGILVDDPKALDHDVSYVWEAPFTEEKMNDIRFILCAGDAQRVGFNNLNYDDLVLANYGVTVPEEDTHDAMLALKTVWPGLPAHGLKFLSWLLLGDPHWAEFEMKQKGHRFGDGMSEELKKYHRYDLVQHKRIWEYVREEVVKDIHWEAYQLDKGMKFPLQEITYEGGVLVDVKKAEATLLDLAASKIKINAEMLRESKGAVKNANSNKQVGAYLDGIEDWALNLTGTGEFQVKKKDLADIIGMTEEEMRKWKVGTALPESFPSVVAMLAWQMRDQETVRKYVQNYYNAAIGTDCNGWIPASYSISRAATRRTLSKSYYKINFQNSTEAIDEFKLIPKGYLGWFIDCTQIENVVHIYESNDDVRRADYEKNVEWNEYVWLCNRILGSAKDKKELDSIKSRQVPHWSVYKLYKTVKLAMNFGMGIRKFCSTLNLDYNTGKSVFEDIHQACPAIRRLQNKVERALQEKGHVQDSFGHIYQGDEPYKVVAYLVQGCGTGSLPKAQLRALYDTEHYWNQLLGEPVGMLNSTTHDEASGLLRLDLGESKIKSILKQYMECMTSRFSPKFDGIPLRAKLYLSTTNWNARKNNEIKNLNQIEIP